MTRRELLKLAAAAPVSAAAACATGHNPAPQALQVKLPLLPNPVRMVAGVNAGIGGPVTPDVAAHYGGYGGEFVIRTPFRDMVTAMQTMYSVDPYPNLKVLWLIENASPMQAAQVPFDFPQTWGVGIGNETDLPPYEWSASRMAETVIDGRNILRMRGWTGRILSSPIYSVDDGDHLNQYLRPVLGYIPDDVIIDLHWYGDSSDYWLGEVRKLNRRVTVSEFGMPSRNEVQDQNQADYIRQKLTDFTRCGVIEAAFLYQHACGSTDSDLDNFGIQRTDGTWKFADVVLANYVRTQAQQENR